MTPRELAALREVWLDQIERTRTAHAAIQATLHNGLGFKTEGVPFEANDFLGTGNRAERIKKSRGDRMLAFKASRMATSDPDLLPEFVVELMNNQKVN